MRWPRVPALFSLLVVLAGSLVSTAGAAAAPPGQTPRRAMLGSNFRISGGALADEQAPAVSYNSVAQEYLVVWEDSRRLAAYGYEIYGVRVGLDGNRIGKDLRLSRSSALADQTEPAVAYNAVADEYLVVWEDERPDTIPGSDIYGQRVAADGALVGSNFRIDAPGSAGASAEDPAVASNPVAGEYLVVWADWRDAEFPLWGASIYGARLAADGTLMGADFEVGFGSLENVDPEVAYHAAASRYLVVWTGIHWADEEIEGDVDCSEIFGQFVSATGSRLGGVFLVSAPGCVSWPGAPGVTSLAAANYHYLVVWEEEGGLSRGRDIFGRRVVVSSFAPSGPVGDPFRISGGGAVGDETHPRPALNAQSGGVIVVWKDTRNQTTRGPDIYGRALSSLIVVSGLDFRISGKAATANEGHPGVAYGAAANEYLVVFHTNRFLATRGWEIHGQRVGG
jgi:hypothetical protein